MAQREINYLISANDQASRVLTGVGANLGGLGKATAALNTKLLGLGAAGMVAGGLLLKGLAGAVSAAAEFENRMAEVWTLMDDRSGKTIEELGDKIHEMSLRIPQSASSLAEGLYLVTSAGWKGAEGLTVLEQAAKLATAGLSTTDVSADALVRTLNAYNLTAADSQRVSDVLFGTVKIGITRLEELAPAWGMVAGLAASAGVTVEELGAAFATLTKNGLQTNIAGTAIRGMINTLLGPSDALTARWGTLSDKTIQVTMAQEGLGGVVSKLQGYFQLQTKDLKAVADAAGDDETQFLALAEAKGMVTAEMREMFPNVRALIGFLGLMANGGETWNASLTELQGNVGATDVAFEKMMTQLPQRWQLAKNAFESFKISVGKVLLPVVIKIADALGAVGKWFAKLPGPVKTFIAVFAGIAGVTLLLGGLVAVIVAIGGALWTALAPALPVIAAIAAALLVLGLVVAVVIKYWDKIGPAISDVWAVVRPVLVDWWNKLKEIGEAVWKWMGEAWQKIKGPLLTTLKLLWSGVVQLWRAFVSIWNHIKGPLMSVFKQLWGLVKELYGVFKALWPVLKVIGIIIGAVVVVAFKILVTWLRVVGWIWGTIIIPIIKVFIFILRVVATVIKTVIGAVIAVFRFLWNIVGPIFKAIGAALVFLGQVFKAIWNAIVAVFRWAWNLIVTIWNTVGKPLVEALKVVWDAVYAIWSKIWEIIKSVLEFQWNVISAVFKVVFGVLIAIAKVIWDVLVSVWQVVWGTIKAVLNVVWNVILSIWNAIFPPLKAIAEAIWNTLVAIWQGVWNTVSSVVSAVWNGLVSTWHTVIDPIVDVVHNIWNGVAGAWEKIWGGVKSVFKGAINGIIKVINLFIRGWNYVPFHAKVEPIGEMKHKGGGIPRTGTYFLEAGEFVLRKAAVARLGLDVVAGLNWGGGPMMEPATTTVPVGGGGATTLDNSQRMNIETLNLYGVNNVDEMMSEINRRATRANLRSRASREEWD